MNIKVDILPQPKQWELTTLFQDTRKDSPSQIGYGGARGGGKSKTIRDTALTMALKDPGTTSTIIRRVFPDVKVNHIDKFFQEFPDLRPFYRVQDHELILPEKLGSSKIVFNYAETQSEVDRKFWGPEYKYIYLDQAEQFNEHEHRIIKSTNRWPGTSGSACKMGSFFNPGGVGTEYLRRVYWLKQYHSNERASDFAFIQAYGWDNFQWFAGQVDITQEEFYKLPNDQRFHLFITETQYGRELNSLPDSLRAGHLLGSFESFAGQYFAGVWDEGKIILTMDQAERLIQPWWTRWMATDWGFAHYASHQWLASGKVGPDELYAVLGIQHPAPVDIVVIYREHVTNETAEADLASQIVEMTPQSERKLIRRHWMGPDAWAKKGSAHPVAEQMAPILRKGGLPTLEKANNDRVGGWRLLYNCFRKTCSLRAENPNDPDPSSPMLLISANCPQVISSMPMLVRDPKKLEDVLKVPGAMADDVGDCTRYAVFSMLDPLKEAPMHVRAQQIYESIGGQDAEAMTRRAMAMRIFEQQNRKSNTLMRGGQRWRRN